VSLLVIPVVVGLSPFSSNLTRPACLLCLDRSGKQGLRPEELLAQKQFNYEDTDAKDA
jgi:hypothetical protein